MKILDKWIEENQAPVWFVGSGVPKRYTIDSPSWIELLLLMWCEIGGSEDEFYRELSVLRNNHGRDPDSDFWANAEIASLIEDKFNKSFFAGDISIDGLTYKDVYQNHINPFKHRLADFFAKLHRSDDDAEEQDMFARCLSEARAIITTNYDHVLEDFTQNSFRPYIGESDLFMSGDEYGCIYKIHGDIARPDSIVITEKDYRNFDEDQNLLSARLVNYFLSAPIIFIGYSLTDRNIQRVLRRFARRLSEEQRSKLTERILYIEYNPDITEPLERQIVSDATSLQYTAISTNDFLPIFNKISKIRTGLPATEVRKYMDLVRKLVVDRSAKGRLKTLLVNPSELDGRDLDDDSIVIAIGNERFLYKIPDRLSYFRNYIGLEDDLDPELALKFIAGQKRTTRIPYRKYQPYLDKCRTLNDEDKRIVQDRFANESASLKNALDKVDKSCRIECRSIDEIKKKTETRPPSTTIEMVAYNIDRLPKQDVKAFLVSFIDGIDSVHKSKNIMSSLGKLLLIWDLKCN